MLVRHKIAIYGFSLSVITSVLFFGYEKWVDHKMRNALATCQASHSKDATTEPNDEADSGNIFELMWFGNASSIVKAIKLHPCNYEYLTLDTRSDDHFALSYSQRAVIFSTLAYHHWRDKWDWVMLACAVVAMVSIAPTLMYLLSIVFRRSWRFFLVRIREFSDAVRGIDPPSN